MSQDEFHQRLARIRENTGQQRQSPTSPQKNAQPRSREGSTGHQIAAGLLLAAAYHVFRITNRDYETLKMQLGLAGVLGILALGFVLFLIGAGLIARIFFGRKSQRHKEPSAYQNSGGLSQPQPSKRAALFSSFFGLALGVAACFTMALSAVASQVDTAKAKQVATVAPLIAVVSVLLAVTISCAGLLFPGRGLWRVLFYYAAGGMLAFVALKAIPIRLLEWPTVVGFLQ